jgi:hypothetical protein
MYELGWLANITREMECCEARHEPSLCEKQFYEGSGEPQPPLGVDFLVEAGCQYQQASLNPYLAVGASVSGKYGTISATIASDRHLDVFGAFRYDYFFYDLPLSTISPVKVWTKPNGGVVTRFVVPYVGTEGRVFGSEAKSESQQNVHIGLARFNANSRFGFLTIFLHGGITTDYAAISNFEIRPFAQAGINVNLGTR